MTAVAAPDRTPLRRWMVSAAIVVLVHGGIATVVAWRKVMAPAEPPRPIVIEVVPMPIAPVPPKTEPAPLVPNTAPGTPIESLEAKTGEKTAPTDHETAGPAAVEQTPSETAPVTLAPPQSPEGERGVTPWAARVNRSADNPIDTRIGEPNRNPKQTTKPNNNNARKITLTRPYSSARQPRNQGAGDIVRNTIGLPIPSGIPSTKSPYGTNEAKNAVGVPETNPARDVSTNTISRTVRNAIGARIHPAAGGVSIGRQQGVDPPAPRGTTPRAGINGSIMGRRNTSSIGGAARNPASVINGTTVRH